MATTNLYSVGDRVRFRADQCAGTVEDIDYALVKVKFDDGQYGLFLHEEATDKLELLRGEVSP